MHQIHLKLNKQAKHEDHNCQEKQLSSLYSSLEGPKFLMTDSQWHHLLNDDHQQMIPKILEMIPIIQKMQKVDLDHS